MKNRIEDLRNHLFATLEALQDEKNPMDLARAKAISDVSQTIINSAKVEVEFLNAVSGATASGFFPKEEVSGTPQRPKLVARN